MNRTIAFGFAVTTLFAALATPGHAQTTEAGGLLRDNQGKTLYVFDRDSGGKSNCVDACATAWPPFMAKDGAQAKDKLTLHARADGRMQWGFDGKPLYYFAGDAAAGEANGEGSGGVWHTLKAAAAAPKPAVQADPNKY